MPTTATMAQSMLNSPLLLKLLLALVCLALIDFILPTNLVSGLPVIDRGGMWFLRGCWVGILGYGVGFRAWCIAVVKMLTTSLNIAWRTSNA